jgi:uncharacterized protein YpmB
MSENKKNVPISTIVFSVIALVIGFTIGLFYQKSKTPSFAGNGQFQMANRSGSGAVGATGANGQRARGTQAGANNFRQTIGDIINSDDKSITVKLADGSSKIVLLSDSTSINQSTSATKADLKTGTKVAVMGSQNTDGSITGQTININPRVPTVTPGAKQ